ncbi:MAG: hypothetical protein QM733_15780 [Ilumatobacteraceae bacterium]
MIDSAIAAAEQYQRVHRGSGEPAEAFANRQYRAWDEVLDAVDGFLFSAEVRHLELVVAAGCSGAAAETKLAQLGQRREPATL